MLNWQGCDFAITPQHSLQIGDLHLSPGSCTVFVGSNGSGKSALARALCGELPLIAGQRHAQPNACRLSFEQQQALIEQDWQRRRSGVVTEAEALGVTVHELLAERGLPEQLERLTQRFGLLPLLNRPYRFLSSGEGRKVLLAQALLSAPELIVLDEPFDGLDIQARSDLALLLAELHAGGQTLVLIVNRFEEIPEFAERLGLLSELALLRFGPVAQLLAEAEIAQLAHVERLGAVTLPPPASGDEPVPIPAGALVCMRQVTVQYEGQRILDRLDWQLQSGEHWHIVGPNGAGKSTLLSLITGDHPQGYCNDLTLFGRRRGSGESIWQIKQHIGYLSPSLHLDYRVSTTPLAVILSGYFDSIGLYQTPGDQRRKLAYEWLALLGMQALAQVPFHSLSFGQQRLLLIVRALVKHPRLLILDEPLQGLDPLNRRLVIRFIECLLQAGCSQLLFVSHHTQDAPRGLTHRLSFIPREQGGYRYVCEAIADDE
jgi:molybdate transport system ATP-binding protein